MFICGKAKVIVAIEGLVVAPFAVQVAKVENDPSLVFSSFATEALPVVLSEAIFDKLNGTNTDAPLPLYSISGFPPTSIVPVNVG